MKVVVSRPRLSEFITVWSVAPWYHFLSPVANCCTAYIVEKKKLMFDSWTRVHYWESLFPKSSLEQIKFKNELPIIRKIQ